MSTARCRVTYGDVRLLFQADAGLPVEAHLAGRAGAVELLKVGHHGQGSATSDAWLAELEPHEAVISVGRHNHCDHPAPEVVARLARHGSAIPRTDRDGTITFKTDGTREHTDVRQQHGAVSCRVTRSTRSRAASPPSSMCPRRASSRRRAGIGR